MKKRASRFRSNARVCPRFSRAYCPRNLPHWVFVWDPEEARNSQTLWIWHHRWRSPIIHLASERPKTTGDMEIRSRHCLCCRRPPLPSWSWWPRSSSSAPTRRRQRRRGSPPSGRFCLGGSSNNMKRPRRSEYVMFLSGSIWFGKLTFFIQVAPSAHGHWLGWLWSWQFFCLANSAKADEITAEMSNRARSLIYISQPNLSPRADGTP